MQTISRATGALTLLAALAAAQNETPRHCTGMMPLPVPAATQLIGQQTCAVGFAGALGGIGVKFENALCPLMLVVTPPHSTTQWQQGALTDAAVNGQVPVFLVTFKCVSHYLLVFWTHDTCEVSEIRAAGNVDNYALVRCVPLPPAGS